MVQLRRQCRLTGLPFVVRGVRMLTLNGLVSIVFLLVMMSLSSSLSAQVVELGESQLHGKKDQPEAMTFVSRAPLDVSEVLAEWKPMKRIGQEISRDIFRVST